MSKEEIWSFKYEPTSIDDMILNDEIKPKLQKAIVEKPNMLLYGSAGVGKGTFTHIFLKETGLDHMWVNASDKTGIEYIRSDVRPYANAPDINNNLKVVVFNEADALSSGQSGAQKILRQLMEDTYKLTRFIFLANYDQYIIPEIKSRCEVIAVDRPPRERIGLFALKILKSEGIQFDKKTVMEIVDKCYPDIRKTIWSIQENSINGKLVNTNTYSSENVFRDILNHMKEKDPNLVRSDLKNNYINYIQLYEYLYDNAGEFTAAGNACIAIGEAMRWDGSVANKEINFMAMFSQMLTNGAIR